MGSFANETVDRLAERLMAPQGAEDIPVILCRRHTPHPRTYLLWDAGWEGLKKVHRGGKTAFEIDHNFNLRIEMDGLCAIPDTKNNRIKLEQVSRPSTIFLDKDPITGIAYNPPRKETYPPDYTKVQKSLMEKGIMDEIIARVMAQMGETPDNEGMRMAAQEDRRPIHQRNVEPLDIVDDEEDGFPAQDVAEAPKAARPARKPAKRKKTTGKAKGRPKAPDPLLTPIRGGNDDE